MKKKFFIIISILIILILSVCALNTISRANTKFLGSAYDNFFGIHIEEDKISIYFADKEVHFKNIFSQQDLSE
jgi:uncharacterized membrane protein